jgi:predicted DNA-binding protein (MmcQ/YjbR family)
MATFNDLRKIALSLPLSYEDLHFGGPAFRVKQRKYALLWRETGQTILKLPKDRLEALIHSRPDRVQAIKVGIAFWADVALERFDRKELNALVTEAWSTVVSKTVAREYLSALGRDGRLADDWRFLYPALARESPPRRVIR